MRHGIFWEEVKKMKFAKPCKKNAKLCEKVLENYTCYSERVFVILKD